MPDGDHLLIGLHHPRGAAMTRFKREANLQGWDGCSTCHDGLLAVVTSASQEAAPSGVGPPETRHHSQGEVVSVEYSSRTLPKSWQLCRKCTDPSLWRACGCWREEADFDDSCFQPLAQCGGKYGQFGQQRFMVNVVKTAAYVCIQHPWTTIFTIHSRMDSFDGVHGTASWPKTVGIGLKACFPLWLQCCFDYCLHDPVLDGRDPLSTLPLFPSYLWNM